MNKSTLAHKNKYTRETFRVRRNKDFFNLGEGWLELGIGHDFLVNGHLGLFISSRWSQFRGWMKVERHFCNITS